MIYQILDGQTVINTISADLAFMQAQYPDGNYVEVAEPVAPAAATPRHISVGAFFDRFGALKWGILADTSPGVHALIKDCSVRKYVDLDNPALPFGLDMLLASGHSIDKPAILTGAVTEAERP